MRRVARALAPAMLLAAPCAIAEPPSTGADIARLRDFVRTTGDGIWPGIGTAPFDLLLITPDRETLLCRDVRPAEFSADGIDPVTRCSRAVRPRGDLPADLLAAMPLFGPPATIVVGTPAATGRARADWMRTILHEHFHQWQLALPGYFDRVRALDLSGGDQSGSWMLRFPFPYDDPHVAVAYTAASQRLAGALAARGTPRFGTAVANYRAARSALTASLNAPARRYLEFALWQEGGARWAEFALGAAYPEPAVRVAAAAARARSIAALKSPDLATQRRDLVYPFGAGELALLDACDRGWRARYARVLSIAALWESTSCGRGRVAAQRTAG